MAVTKSKKTASDIYRSRQDDAIREKLILDHIEFVHQVLHTMLPHLPPGVDFENLTAAGLLGLTEAAQNFDLTRGVKFKSFAYLRIRGAVVDELRSNSPLPQKMLKQISEIRAAIEHLEPPVTAEMISDATSLSIEVVEESLAAMRVCSPQSWDEVGGFANVALSMEDNSPSKRLEREELVEELADGIEQLPERERAILAMYHVEQMLLKEIGKALGISESRTSRLLARAEYNLRQIMMAKQEDSEKEKGESDHE